MVSKSSILVGTLGVLLMAGCAADAEHQEENVDAAEAAASANGEVTSGVLASGSCQVTNAYRVNGVPRPVRGRAKILKGGKINLFFDGAPTVAAGDGKGGNHRNNAFVELNAALMVRSSIDVKTVDQISYNMPGEFTLFFDKAPPRDATDVRYRLKPVFDVPGDDPSCEILLSPGGTGSCSPTKTYAEQPLSARITLLPDGNKIKAEFTGALTRSQNNVGGRVELTRREPIPHPIKGHTSDDVKNRAWETREIKPDNLASAGFLFKPELTSVTGKVRMVFDLPNAEDVSCTVDLR